MAAKTETETETPAVKVPAEPTIHLDEFCQRLSERVKTYTLIAGFEREMRGAGNLRATSSAYLASFEAFKTRAA
jgi:hypothetical protein